MNLWNRLLGEAMANITPRLSHKNTWAYVTKIAHIATSCNIFTSSIGNMNKTLITLRTSPFKMAALGGGRLILANQNSLYHAS